MQADFKGRKDEMLLRINQHRENTVKEIDKETERHGEIISRKSIRGAGKLQPASVYKSKAGQTKET